MRIAFIAPFGLQPKGTVSARMLPLAHALAHRGHTIRIVVPPWDDPAAQPGETILQSGQSGVQVVTLPLPRRLPYSLALTYGLVKQSLVDFQPDAVHVFKPVGYSGLAGLALAAMRVPWTLDTDDWEGAGGWSDANPYSTAQRLVATIQDALLPRLAPAVTAASRTLEARAWGFGLERRRVFYMPNGVWREKYASWTVEPGSLANLRGRYGLQDKPVLLLYTRFAEFPFQWPLDILQGVMKRHPDVRLLVVGSGFFDEEAQLQADAAQRGIAEHVVTIGHVPESQLPQHLALGDVALYPMEDNLINRAKSPVKVLEPMVMGRVIVAHRVGQAAEFIGDAGTLVPAGDINGMAEAASGLLDDPTRRERLGRLAKERVWARFNWEQLSVVAEDAYRLANNKKSLNCQEMQREVK